MSLYTYPGDVSDFVNEITGGNPVKENGPPLTLTAGAAENIALCTNHQHLRHIYHQFWEILQFEDSEDDVDVDKSAFPGSPRATTTMTLSLGRWSCLNVSQICSALPVEFVARDGFAKFQDFGQFWRAGSRRFRSLGHAPPCHKPIGYEWDFKMVDILFSLYLPRTHGHHRFEIRFCTSCPKLCS